MHHTYRIALHTLAVINLVLLRAKCVAAAVLIGRLVCTHVSRSSIMIVTNGE